MADQEIHLESITAPRPVKINQSSCRGNNGEGVCFPQPPKGLPPGVTLKAQESLNGNAKKPMSKQKHKDRQSSRLRMLYETLRPDTSSPVQDVDIYCNACFLCFRYGGHDYAVKVDVEDPLPGEKSVQQSRNATRRSRLGNLKEIKQDSQVAVMQAIKDALYQQQGRWKKWLWCYGIQVAEEVNFQFDDIGHRGRVPVRITRLQSSVIREKAQDTIDNKPPSIDYEHDFACYGPPYHTEGCKLEQELHGTPCLSDQLREAEIRVRGVERQLWLKECLQDPHRIQTKLFLEEGLLQKSFVYSAEEAGCVPTTAEELSLSEERRGVFVTLGWDTDRMLWGLRVGSIYTIFGLAVVWLGVVFWAQDRGDWSTALAFGQVLAASIALLWHHT